MSQFLNHEIELYLHDTLFPAGPKVLSFAMSDSIYSLYNSGTMTVNDAGGMYLERLSFIEGTPLEITYGIHDQVTNTAKYTITNGFMETPSNSPGLLSGEITVHFRNRWYNQQQIRSRATTRPISEVISNIVTPLDAIDGTEIEETATTETWYQPLINDAEFIDKILVPNAYTSNAYGTPFYAFITNDNVFRFKSAHRMYSANIADELTFPSNINRQQFTPQTIIDARYIKDEGNPGRHLRNRTLFRIDADTGNLLNQTDRTTDHLRIQNRFLPYITDMSLRTGYMDFGRGEQNVGERNTELAAVNNSHRPGMFAEHLLLITPLNPHLRSGQKIQVNIGSADRADRSENSKTFSGPWVIENCEHIWNGENSKGYTKLIVGRKYITTGATYFIRDRLVR